MRALAWNPRGVGDSRTVQDLERLVHTHKPQLVFLSETKKRTDVVESLRWRLGLKHVVTFYEEGKGRGLALF
jgi:AmiR/NasT family two-component response regulator